MRKLLALFLVSLLPLSASATGSDVPDAVERWRADPGIVLKADEVDLEAFQWIARPVVVFANSPADPRFAEQMDLLMQYPDELLERDVVLITDTDPAARSPVRLKLRPRGFMFVLIGKDGGVKLRKPLPWDVRELSHKIGRAHV